jgi:hypothetical protein
MESEGMERLSYAELLEGLQQFDPWLTSLGLKPCPSDRIHQAFGVLRKADQASRNGRETDVYSKIDPKDWFPLTEAVEAHEVFTAFRNDQSPEFRRELRRALQGPGSRVEEGSNNSSDGRNIWFQLALAAEWKLRGASVIVEEPDLKLTKDSVEFLIACKRPGSQQSIDKNIREAIKQLQRNLDETRTKAFGVAAISVSRAFNHGDKVFSGGNEELATLLHGEIEKSKDYLHAINDPRICCLLLHIATPSNAGESVDLLAVSQTVAWDPGHRTIGSAVFRKHAEDMARSTSR